MLKHIEPSCYDEDKYEAAKRFYERDYINLYKRGGHAADDCVRSATVMYNSEDFDEEGMDKFIILVSGMLWAIEQGGIADDDPVSLAYNVWDALKDFSTGNYDDLFTPEDLVLIKKDVKTLYDYFDKHPALKGD